MKKTITLLFALVAALFATNAVAADFKGTSEQYPKSSYATDEIDFSLTEVAAALGVDADSLLRAVEAKNAVWSVVYTNEDGEESSSTTATTGEGGFYMDAEGTPVSWKNGPQHLVKGESHWYINFSYDAEADHLTALVGQYAGLLQGGDVLNAHLALTLGEAVADFYVTLNVLPKPELSVRTLADITVLKTIEVTVEQDARSNATADDVTVDVADAASLLGYTEAELAQLIGFALHTNSFDATAEVPTDTLARATNWQAPGFSFGTYMDDETGADSPHLLANVAAAYNKCTISSVQYADGQLTFKLAQVANALKSGDKYYADLYILHDGKAVVVRVNLNITEHIVLTPAQLSIVGEQSFVYEYNTDDTSAENYLASMKKTAYTIDMAAILAAFPEGVTADDLVFMATYDAETNELLDRDAIVASGYHSSNGVYMTWEGTLCAWGASGIAAKIGYNSGASFDFAYVPSSPDDGSHLQKSIYLVYQNKYAYEFKFDITLHSTPAAPEYVSITNPQDHLDAGKAIYTYDEATDTYTQASAIEDGVQYYVLKEDYIAPKPEYTFDTCETVDEVEMDIDLVLCESTRTLSRYRIENGEQVSDSRNIVTDLGSEYLKETIGTDSPAYYVAVKGKDSADNDSIYYAEAKTTFSSTSLSGNNGGAWLTKESYDGSWGSGSPIGFSHLNYQIEWWKHDAQDFEEGEENTVHFYVVNLQTGKKVKYTFHITWVSSLSTAEVVGQEEVVLGTRGDGDNEYVLEFDLAAVADALGASVEELEAAGVLYALNKNGRAVAAEDGSYFYDELDGIKLNEKGQIMAEDESDLVFYINYDFEQSAFVAYVIEDYEAEKTFTTTVYIDFNGKRYQFDIVVTPDPDNYEPAAIHTISGEQQGATGKAQVYNLAGERLTAPQRGINIVGGKKVLVK